MTRYVYAEIRRDVIDYGLVCGAEAVLAAAREALDLPPTHIRWYSRDPGPGELTRYGRLIDVADDRHLAGWHTEPPFVAVRADRPRREVMVTVAHECWHADETRHGRPPNEHAAERFAERLVSQLEGEAP